MAMHLTTRFNRGFCRYDYCVLSKYAFGDTLRGFNLGSNTFGDYSLNNDSLSTTSRTVHAGGRQFATIHLELGPYNFIITTISFY